MITLDKKTLLDPLRNVCGAVARTSTLPTLDMLLADYGKGRMTLSGSDLERMITVSVPADTQGEGRLLIPAHKTLAIVNALNDETLTISPNGERHKITAGRSRFMVSTLPPEDYPIPENDEIRARVELDAATFLRLLEVTAPAMAKNDVRYYLNGALLEIDNTRLSLVATDGHRLHMAQTETDTGMELQIIIPRNTVDTLLKLPTEGSITLSIGYGTLIAESQSLRLWSKTIDGRYPDYKRRWPADKGAPCLVNAQTLVGALRRCAILSQEKFRSVRIQFHENTLYIEASNNDSDNAADIVDCEYTGPKTVVGANSTMLATAIESMHAETVTLSTDGNTFILIDPVTEGNIHRRALLAPMRL